MWELTKETHKFRAIFMRVEDELGGVVERNQELDLCLLTCTWDLHACLEEERWEPHR